MSEALERVIAEQQKEIDALKARDLNNIKAWERENRLVEEVVMWAFSVMNNHESPECHFALKRAIMNLGFCPTCECRVCECEGQYD